VKKQKQEPEKITPQETAEEQKLHEEYKDEILEEEKPRPTVAEIIAWRNDPPEPGASNIARAPSEAAIIRRGYTTLHMAHAARNAEPDSEKIQVVELRDNQGAVLAYCLSWEEFEQ
jgi:hypothetical protein